MGSYDSDPDIGAFESVFVQLPTALIVECPGGLLIQ